MIDAVSAMKPWSAPCAPGPVNWIQEIPGSKSITNRAYVLAALAEGESQLLRPLRSRDTDLMAAGLSAMGTSIRFQQVTTSAGECVEAAVVTPSPLHSADINCGLAGTVLRFLPVVAALAQGTVSFDGDPQARRRPVKTTLTALRDLGITVHGDALPFSVEGHGQPTGGRVVIDASASSQFVSGLLLAASQFSSPVTIVHRGGVLPSQPHIDMTIGMLRTCGVEVDAKENQWTVIPGAISPRTWTIEPDLSNATPFLAAAAVSGGTVRIPDWPSTTHQPGDAIRGILAHMGCEVLLTEGTLNVTGPSSHSLHGVHLDMSDIGELTPTVAALAALADTPSTLRGIGHLRGHETDRLAALCSEINALGGACEELEDGLHIVPATLHAGTWHSYADHRMATAGAIIGVKVPGIVVEDIATTSKTLPGFSDMWETMIRG